MLSSRDNEKENVIVCCENVKNLEKMVQFKP